MTSISTPAKTAAIGLYASGVALAPSLSIGAVLAAPLLLVPMSWWLLLGTNHWLAAFLASAILLPPLPIPIGNSGPHPSMLFAMAGVAIGLLRARQWSLRFDWLGRAMLVFFAILLASVGSAVFFLDGAVAIGSLIRVLLFGISLYVFFYTVYGPGKDTASNEVKAVRWLFGAATIGAAFACIDFYFQFPAPAGYGAQFVWLSSGVFRRAQGLFYEASTLGNFCTFFLVMIAVYAAEPRDSRVLPRSVLLLGGAVLFGALVLSYSRGSIVALLASLLTLLFLRPSRQTLRFGLVVIPLSLAAGIVALYFLAPTFGEMYWKRLLGSMEFLFSDTNLILSGRLESWRALASLVLENPWYLVFGAGYKTLPYADLAGRPLVADNMYLSLLVETGVAGLLAFLWMNVCILRAGYRAAKHTNRKAALLGTWIFCFWVGELLQMFSGDLLTYWRVLPLYFWVLASAVRLSSSAYERPLR